MSSKENPKVNKKPSKEGSGSSSSSGKVKKPRPGRAEMVVVRNMYALMMTRRLTVLSILAIICAFLSVLSAFQVIKVKTPPQYIQLTEDGRVFPLTPISRSNVSDGDLLRFASDSVKWINTYDYMNWRDQLQTQAHRFTEAGWQIYLDELVARDTLTAVENRKMVVSAEFTGPAQIEKQGLEEESNRYTWIVKVPVDVKYYPSGGDSQVLSQKGVVTLYIVRVPLATNQRGYAIWLYQFDTEKK